MGAAIAALMTESGRAVTVVDVDPSRVGDLPGSVKAGRAIDDLHGTDLVIEAVDENADLKRVVLGQIASVVGNEVPIVTTTTGFSVTDLAADILAPTRVAGLHFSIRAPKVSVVEVVRGLQSEESLTSRLVTFVRSLGRDAIEVNDRPGFLVDSILLPYLNDVVQALDDELATAEDIDLALELGLGYKRGLLAMLDDAGLDVHLDETSALYERTADPRYAPPPLLRRMVVAGRHGTKNGRGFRSTDIRKA
ncbi:3-hydroxybutyryl-CoA dehydrogenase [Rhodococcus fascians]|nr:3-hydroxybutyryl-CoA dehydrogenase [Rhodococcus fascians]MBY4114681.1 3-hydroxybutyryl-CoA dehydrogenase [Rhodococcus fascians]